MTDKMPVFIKIEEYEQVLELVKMIRKKLEDAKANRILTKEEGLILRSVRKNLKDAEQFLEQEIEKIEGATN